jgi:hypothetical protein
VNYARVGLGLETATPAPPSLAPLAEELQQTLQDALAFSLEHGLDEFVDPFEAALQALTDDGEPELHGLAPPGELPLPAARLLAAAFHAWVFGGMGSWSDVGFEGEDEAQYQRISERLYRLIHESLLEAVNLSFPASGRR